MAGRAGGNLGGENLEAAAPLLLQMGRRAPSVPTDPAARSGRPAPASTYAQEIARLRRVKAAALRTSSQCEDHLAEGAPRPPARACGVSRALRPRRQAGLDSGSGLPVSSKVLRLLSSIGQASRHAS